MPGTKRNDSHRNNHQHHFFHTGKGKKTNLPVKPTKRQQDLHEKSFQEKNTFVFVSEVERMEHLQAFDNLKRDKVRHLSWQLSESIFERNDESIFERNDLESQDVSNRVTPSSSQPNWQSKLNRADFRMLVRILQHSPALMLLILPARQHVACNDDFLTEESSSSLSM